MVPMRLLIVTTMSLYFVVVIVNVVEKAESSRLRSREEMDEEVWVANGLFEVDIETVPA